MDAGMWPCRKDEGMRAGCGDEGGMRECRQGAGGAAGM